MIYRQRPLPKINEERSARGQIKQTIYDTMMFLPNIFFADRNIFFAKANRKHMSGSGDPTLPTFFARP